MSLPLNYKITILCLWLMECLLISYQYWSQVNTHERIAAKGKLALVETRIYDGSGTKCIHLSFVTKNAQKIEADRKCGGDCENVGYKIVYYNPEQPEEYELLYDQMTYNHTWKIIFFFAIYFPMVAFATYRIILFIYKIRTGQIEIWRRG